jgi:hypothetical protein
MQIAEQTKTKRKITNMPVCSSSTFSVQSSGCMQRGKALVVWMHATGESTCCLGKQENVMEEFNRQGLNLYLPPKTAVVRRGSTVGRPPPQQHVRVTAPAQPQRPLPPQAPHADRPSVFGPNLQCKPVRGVNFREECHWSHACPLQANMRGIQWHPRV